MSPNKIPTYTDTKLPSFAGMKVFILSGAFYGSAVQLFAEAGFSRADSVEEADVVVFLGGVDVNPDLYGQTPIKETQHPSEARDKLETEVYEECVKRGIPMFGICRGAQFLHVMNDGELWQDVQGHAGTDHVIYDCEKHVFVNSNSIHHQMLMWNKDLDVIATCKDQISKVFKTDEMTVDLNKEGANADVEMEIEAGCYMSTKCFFVQGHPEVGSPEFRSWSMNKFQDFLLDCAVQDEERLKLGEIADWQRTAVM